eukprot:55891_1
MDSQWWNKVHGVDGISVLSTMIQSSLLIVIIIISFISIKYICLPNLRSYKILLPYSLSIILITICCSLTAISSLLTSIYMQINNRYKSFLFVGLNLFFYNISLTSIYILFIFRIYLMLKQSLHKLTLFQLTILLILALTLISIQMYLLYLVTSPDIHISHNWRVIDIISFISMSIFYLGSTIIIILFATKLKLLLVNPDYVELSDAMTKMALLICLSIFSSGLIWILLSTEWMYKETSRFVTYVYDVFIVIDATINVLCTYLSFPFGINLYEKLFGKLHIKFKEWCKP